MKTALFFSLAFCASAFAAVISDTPSKFVFEDFVRSTSASACDGGGVRLAPENAVFLPGSALPYRAYRVALPANTKPSVSVSDESVSSATIDWCPEDTLVSKGIQVSNPVLRDGLWVADIRIPLVSGSSSRWTLRTKFKITVAFSGSAQGKKPGKRILESVLNQTSAARFGTGEGVNSRALRKASQSELSEVTWLTRFLVGDKEPGGTSEDGLYAVSFSEIRNALSTQGRQEELDGISVSKLRLYGASPDTLPDVIRGTADILPTQLFQIPIEVRDHNGKDMTADGIFDDGDSIVFVGYGTSFWKRADLEDTTLAAGQMDYYFSSSPYSFYQYFQLGWSASGTGSRLAYAAQPSGTAKTINWLNYARVEKDAYLRDTYYGNDGGWEDATGKEWFWYWHSPVDTMTLSSAILTTDAVKNLTGRIAGGQEYIAFTYYPHRSTYASSISEDIVQNADKAFSSYPYSIRMSHIAFSAQVNGATLPAYDRLLPGGNFQISGPGFKDSDNSVSLTMLPNNFQYDRFDGYSIAYQWTPALKSSDSAVWLLPGRAGGVISIPAGPDASLRVLKFRNFEPVALLTVKNGFAKDSADASADYRYLLYRADKFKKLASIEGIPAKVDGILGDISRISSKTEYLIIAPEVFQKPAEALAEFRAGGEAVTAFNTTVVLSEDIYRAYSGGYMTPVALRNYIAYARSVCPDLRYVLLAGNGHFDYRGFHSGYKANRIPPFEKEDATTDDFFGVLDSGESVRFGTYDMDVAVGRLPLASVADFNAYNEKVKQYEQTSKMDNGEWRNSILLAADDDWTGYSIDEMRHTENQEEVADMLTSGADSSNYRFDIKKIYLLDYTADAGGQKPEAASDLINKINQGALFTLYSGHGSMVAWAYEGLLKSTYISDISNKGRYTILGSFSCTVGRFDKGNATSLSETFIQAPDDGAIISIGATRETFSTPNKILEKSILENALFPTGGTIGNAFRMAKGTSLSSYNEQRYNNERYVLLGEPVISLPDQRLSVSLDQKVDTIQALDNMTLSGSVSGLSSGMVRLNILEQSSSKNLTRRTGSGNINVPVVYDGSPVYSEDVAVENGRFRANFITPRKISFGDTAAEIRLWAYGSGVAAIGRGLEKGIAISGTSSYADSLNDKVPPSISIQSCLSPSSGTSFSEGENVTLASPACLQVTIEDSTALDFREQADEGISFEVLNYTDPFHPWPYLEQGSKKAVVRMTFSSGKYPAGTYKFKVAAHDILGNESTKTVNLEITEALSEGLSDVFNAPNPMKKTTTFYFKNLAVNRASNVSILIYNQNGRLVQHIADVESGVTTWDGRDFYGRKLANGLYFYIVKSEVAADGSNPKKSFSRKQKLVISR
ncbi:MAG: C25 family cysteine peptidase [Fibrobacteraceae bacterium]